MAAGRLLQEVHVLREHAGHPMHSVIVGGRPHNHDEAEVELDENTDEVGLSQRDTLQIAMIELEITEELGSLDNL